MAATTAAAITAATEPSAKARTATARRSASRRNDPLLRRFAGPAVRSGEATMTKRAAGVAARLRSGGALAVAEQPAVDEGLSDLDGVQRRALTQVVGHAPKGDAIVDGRIVAQARDVDGILARGFVRGHVAAGLTLVVDHDPRRRA